MPVVRVYVPLGRGDLEALGTRAALPAGPGTPRIAYAVTPALEASAPGLDAEDLEHLSGPAAARRPAAASPAVPAVVA